VFRREIPMPICPQVSDLIDTDGVTNWRPFTLADGGVGTDVVFAVLFGLVEFWRAIQNKTTNTYIIEIAI
jgi:hypothetical protein